MVIKQNKYFLATVWWLISLVPNSAPNHVAESLVTDGMTMSNDLVLREAGLRQVICIVRERQLRLYGHVAPCGESRPSDSFLSRSEGLVHAEGAPTRFVVA